MLIEPSQIVNVQTFDPMIEFAFPAKNVMDGKILKHRQHDFSPLCSRMCNVMKKGADITMRGRPERQEMLQLEAAMSASFSHKPPSLLPSQPTYLEGVFSTLGKTFHVSAKS